MFPTFCAIAGSLAAPDAAALAMPANAPPQSDWPAQVEYQDSAPMAARADDPAPTADRSKSGGLWGTVYNRLTRRSPRSPAVAPPAPLTPPMLVWPQATVASTPSVTYPMRTYVCDIHGVVEERIVDWSYTLVPPPLASKP